MMFDDGPPEKLKLEQQDLIKNVLHYITIIKLKLPARRTDILKIAMNNQTKDYPRVMRRVERVLNKVFGFGLVGLKNLPKGQPQHPVRCDISEANNFIIVNLSRQKAIAVLASDQHFSTDLPKAALLLILVCTYMNDKPLDEDTIWSILEKMEFARHLCEKREDLRRFLKQTYVDRLYLIREEIKEQEIFRYGWGVRAEVEFSKYAILKFVAQNLGKRVSDFFSRLSKIPAEEIERIDEEDELQIKGRETESTSSVKVRGKRSQLTITQKTQSGRTQNEPSPSNVPKRRSRIIAPVDDSDDDDL